MLNSQKNKSNHYFADQLKETNDYQRSKIKVVYRDQYQWTQTNIGRVIKIGSTYLRFFCDQKNQAVKIPLNCIKYVKFIDTFKIVSKRRRYDTRF